MHQDREENTSILCLVARHRRHYSRNIGLSVLDVPGECIDLFVMAMGERDLIGTIPRFFERISEVARTSLLVILRNLHGPIVIKGGLGDAFVLIAAVGIGFAYIPGKRLTGHGDAFQINLLRLFVASCFLLPFLALQANGLIMPFSWSVIAVLVIYIVANFGIGYVLLQVGLSLLQAWEASVITLTLPLFATVFAVLLLHESLTFLQLVGGGIILVGGFLVI
jgi:drug/metabolite transporter (DMT)-like permease